MLLNSTGGGGGAGTFNGSTGGGGGGTGAGLKALGLGNLTFDGGAGGGGGGVFGWAGAVMSEFALNTTLCDPLFFFFVSFFLVVS